MACRLTGRTKAHRGERKRLSAAVPLEAERQSPCPWVYNVPTELRVSMTIAAWVVGALVFAVAMTNAVVMIASPRRWFQMPSWLRLQGTWQEDKYSTGWGSVSVRALGAMIIAFFVFATYSVISKRKPAYVSEHIPIQVHQAAFLWGRVLITVALSILLLNGVIMVVSPRQWSKVPQWLRMEGIWDAPRISTRLGSRGMRLTGVAILAFLAWAFWNLFLSWR